MHVRQPPIDQLHGREGAARLRRDAQERRQPEEVIALADTLSRANIRLDRFQHVGVIFAHLQLNQLMPAFSSLLELYDAGYTLPEAKMAGYHGMATW